MSRVSASMAEVVDGAIGEECHHYATHADPDTPGGCKPCWDLAQRVAEVLAANGYGKLEDAWDEGYEDGTNAEHNGGRAVNPHRRPL